MEKILKKSGKVIAFCQSRKVGTMGAKDNTIQWNFSQIRQN